MQISDDHLLVSNDSNVYRESLFRWIKRRVNELQTLAVGLSDKRMGTFPILELDGESLTWLQ